MEITVQRIMNKSASLGVKAWKYYSIMSTLNGLGITPSQANLLAFISLRGTISAKGAKATFSEMFKCPKGSVNNMIYKLRKKGVLIKTDSGEIVINPRLQVDFKAPLVLNITMLGDGDNS